MRPFHWKRSWLTRRTITTITMSISMISTNLRLRLGGLLTSMKRRTDKFRSNLLRILFRRGWLCRFLCFGSSSSFWLWRMPTYFTNCIDCCNGKRFRFIKIPGLCIVFLPRHNFRISFDTINNNVGVDGSSPKSWKSKRFWSFFRFWEFILTFWTGREICSQ